MARRRTGGTAVTVGIAITIAALMVWGALRLDTMLPTDTDPDRWDLPIAGPTPRPGDPEVVLQPAPPRDTDTAEGALP